MLSWLHKRMYLENGTISAADLVCTFFHHYSRFDWTNEMVYDSFFHNTKPRYQRSAKEPMVVLGYHAPNANVAHTSTMPALHILITELKMADKRLSEESMGWDRFFGQHTAQTSSRTDPGMLEFLASHSSYAQINIQYWGRSLPKGKALVGWVESQLPSLIVGESKCSLKYSWYTNICLNRDP
jgi:hypothetical protein